MHLQPRVLGLILIGISAVLLLTAALLGWNAVQRWRAIAAIEDHHLARLGGHANAAREHADQAAQLLPSLAMSALPAIDPSADTAAERLAGVANAVPTGDRAIVATTAAFSGALRGKAETVDGADGVLIKHLAALASGTLPPFPSLPANDAPQAAILNQAAQRHAAAAWKAGNRQELARGLGLVLLTRPAHAEAKAAAAVLTAIDVGGSSETITALTSALGTKGADLLRRAALLAPERAALLLALIPADQRTPAEAQAVVGAGGNPSEKLEILVAQGLAAPEPALLANLFRRCLDQDKPDLARQIADKAVEQQQREMRIALAQYLGDVAALATLQSERTDLKPTTSPPVGSPGMVAFHLATPSGLVPRVGDLRARANGQDVPTERIKRWGSLVVLVLPSMSGMVDIDVKLGETTVFAGGVRL